MDRTKDASNSKKEKKRKTGLSKTKQNKTNLKTNENEMKVPGLRLKGLIQSKSFFLQHLPTTCNSFKILEKSALLFLWQKPVQFHPDQTNHTFRDLAIA